MDDQFGGRTDDDLFYDDFEPVESETVVVEQIHYHEPASVSNPPIDSATAPVHTPVPDPTVAAKPARSSPKPRHGAPRKDKDSDTKSGSRQNNNNRQKTSQGLSSSRFADLSATTPGSSSVKTSASNTSKSANEPVATAAKQLVAKEETSPTTAATAPSTTTPEKHAAVAPPSESQPSPPTDAPITTAPQPIPSGPPTALKDKPSNRRADSQQQQQARIGSGANPRQKLTEAELTAKMEAMKLLNAEKTRKFEKAQQDEVSHNEAYARDLEEARRRRAEAEERRKRAQENQKQLNSEREKNRARKLKAMSAKEGGWDEGKVEAAEEEARRGFRGSNGGIRGFMRGGLGGSRFSEGGEEPPDVDRFLEDRPSRGGRGGRGRGGRGGARGGGHDGGSNQGNTSAQEKQSVPKQEDFPALKSDGVKETDFGVKPAPVVLPLPPISGGKWDEEMEAADEAAVEVAVEVAK